MALYRDVHSRTAVRDRFADDNEYAAELVQVGWMTGESRREVVPKSRWSPSCEFLFRISNLIIDHAPIRNWNSANQDSSFEFDDVVSTVSGTREYYR